MPRLPSMKIDPKTSNVFPASVMPRIDKTEKLFGLITGEKWPINKFSYPVHFVSVGQVEGDLNILVRVLDHDDAVVINVGVLPFALEKDCATFLDLGGMKMGRFEK